MYRGRMLSRYKKKLLNQKSDLKGKVRIPILRGFDGVTEDLRILGMKNWWYTARNRDVWNSYEKLVSTMGCSTKYGYDNVICITPRQIY